MPPKLADLVHKGLATPQSGLEQLIQFEVVAGSAAYAIDSDTSDLDMLAWYIPPKDVIFPHLRGMLPHFDGSEFYKLNQKGKGTYHQPHMFDPSARAGAGQETDYTAHNVMKFVDLLLGNNPTVLEVLFMPQRCITFNTPVGMMLRDNRHMFLSRLIVQTFCGYAHSQLRNLRQKEPSEDSKRHALIEKYGYDTKYGTHIVRLLDQGYQALTECDIDVERSKEKLKDIKAGKWRLDQIEDYFKIMEPRIREAADESRLPVLPDRDKARALLTRILDKHFGSIDDVFVEQGKDAAALSHIREILSEAGY